MLDMVKSGLGVNYVDRMRAIIRSVIGCIADALNSKLMGYYACIKSKSNDAKSDLMKIDPRKLCYHHIKERIRGCINTFTNSIW